MLRKRFKLENIKRVERAYERFGFLAIGIPAILPPPLPFKIFVATAGALEYPRWKFLLTVMIARSLRYYVEGILAVYYGRRVLLFIKDNGLVVVSIVATIVLIGVLIYLLINRRRNTRMPRLKGPLIEIVHPVTKWLTRLSEYLITYGAFGLFAVALLDSTFVPLPSSADALMLLLSTTNPSWMLLYAFMATSWIGAWLLDSLSDFATSRRARAEQIFRSETAAREELDRKVRHVCRACCDVAATAFSVQVVCGNGGRV